MRKEHERHITLSNVLTSHEVEEQYAHRYPYACTTRIDGPTPDTVEHIMNRELEFLRVPFPRQKYASWRFRTRDDLMAFREQFKTFLLE